MATLIVPEVDLSYPTLGPQIKDFIEERLIFGPGSLAGQPAVLDAEKTATLYRLYEMFPKGHPEAGMRRFQRGAIEWSKGKAKTEFAAWIAAVELHPEAPARFDGWDAGGNPVGRPVKFPYIPMMAVAEKQVSELAFAVLRYILSEGPDADLFDISLERIIRFGARGQEDGKALPVASAPNANDGPLTTHQNFDEPHRMYLPSHRQAHNLMMENLTKRPMEDPWALYTSTAGRLGQASVQEDLRSEAEEIVEGKRDAAASPMFFFARWAGEEHKELDTVEQRIAALKDARGPAGEYGRGQLLRIAQAYDRKGTDRSYWERVQLNRWRSPGSLAFDAQLVQDLARPGELIKPGRFVAGGFDGARRRDSTGFVITDVETLQQQLVAGWEKPEDAPEGWEIDESEVTQAFDHIKTTWRLGLLFADPPYWTETVGTWAGTHPDQVEEYWTSQHKRMAYGLRAYCEAIENGTVTFCGTQAQVDDLVKHLKQAGKKYLKILDDEGEPLWVLAKQDGKRDLMFDFAMAALLSYLAAMSIRRRGKQAPKDQTVMVPRRIR